jgi:hypothetical protein
VPNASSSDMEKVTLLNWGCCISVSLRRGAESFICQRGSFIVCFGGCSERAACILEIVHCLYHYGCMDIPLVLTELHAMLKCIQNLQGCNDCNGEAEELTAEMQGQVDVLRKSTYAELVSRLPHHFMRSVYCVLLESVLCSGIVDNTAGNIHCLCVDASQPPWPNRIHTCYGCMLYSRTLYRCGKRCHGLRAVQYVLTSDSAVG